MSAVERPSEARMANVLADWHEAIDPAKNRDMGQVADALEVLTELAAQCRAWRDGELAELMAVAQSDRLIRRVVLDHA